MGRIECRGGEEPSVEFADYRERLQLKAFYKVFKKATGFNVSAYDEVGDAVLVVTDNAENGVRIEWREDTGCRLVSGAADRKTLAGIAFGMLRYRYAEYKDYEFDLLAGEAAAAAPAEPDEDILEDIEALKALAG